MACLLSINRQKFGYLCLPISPFAHLTVKHSDSLSPQHPSPPPPLANPSDTLPLRKGAGPVDSVIAIENNSHCPRAEECVSSNVPACSRPRSHSKSLNFKETVSRFRSAQTSGVGIVSSSVYCLGTFKHFSHLFFSGLAQADCVIFFSATVNSLSVRISHPVCHRFSFSLAFFFGCSPDIPPFRV